MKSRCPVNPDVMRLGAMAKMKGVGFSIFEDVLSRQECEFLAKALGGGAVGRAGTRNLMSNPAISLFAYDFRLLRLAANFLGAQAVPFRATLFDKSRASNWHVHWHQDRALPLSRRLDSTEWGPWTTKCGVLYALAPAWALERVVALRIHIDSSTNSNGPLHVIPGSHKSGVLHGAEIIRAISAVSSRACIVGQGGVVAMRPLLLHSSRKASDNEPRRVLHIEYASGLNLGNNLQLYVA